MVRGVYISRSGSERMTAQEAPQRYVAQVTRRRSRLPSVVKTLLQHLTAFLEKYSMAAFSSELVASYRDHRLATGKSNNTVRIELAMLNDLIAIAIQGWGLRLSHNPVSTIRKPSPEKVRNRRLNTTKRGVCAAPLSSIAIQWIAGSPESIQERDASVRDPESSRPRYRSVVVN